MLVIPTELNHRIREFSHGILLHLFVAGIMDIYHETSAFGSVGNAPQVTVPRFPLLHCVTLRLQLIHHPLNLIVSNVLGSPNYFGNSFTNSRIIRHFSKAAFCLLMLVMGLPPW